MPEARCGMPRSSLEIQRDLNSRNDNQQRNTLPRGSLSTTTAAVTATTRPRPHSVYSTFPPPRSPPSFRFETPHTSPKPLNLDVPDRTIATAQSRNPSPDNRHPQIPSRPTSPKPPNLSGRTPPPVSPRHKRPVSTSYVADRPNGTTTEALLSPAFLIKKGPQESPFGDNDQVRGPPPVPARTTKPKISTKFTRPVTPTNALTPASVPQCNRRSPFSTPPSSANNSPSRSDNEAQFNSQSSGRLSAYPPPLPLHIPHSNGVGEYHDPPQPRISTAPSAFRTSIDQVRPRMKVEDSVRGQRMSLDACTRPQLPPRSGGFIGGVKARVSRGRTNSISDPPQTDNSGNLNNFLPPPKRGLARIRAKSPIKGKSKELNQNEDFYIGTCYGPDDSDNDGFDEDQSGLSDYPDSSQANRRRPYCKDLPSEIPCRSDVKMFAVCGQYVCTISHSTKVWDIGTGRCIMALQHTEGVRITALAFKPSAKVECEGTVLWLGTSHGELMEVDIASQRVVETRTSAHTKKEVIKIHRCGFELWTLDEGGKIQVWGPDMNGSPNLRNSPTTFRIKSRHSCSIVVDGYLWVGLGKNVEVFKPTTVHGNAFNVSLQQLTASKPTGDITCAAVLNNQPDKVYFGHSDGKVSIYSRLTLECIDVVNVSLYKINSMCGVGDYLWAGFKTGMLYVFDVRTKPWRALKDWPCSDGPVIEVVQDLTSIWKDGRLQVVSLGADNIIRVWDGMLEDDWLEAEMQKRDSEFCDFREIKTLVCTWNAGASKPQDLLSRDYDKAFLRSVLDSVDSPDIIVFGFQELVDLEDKKITAKSFLRKGSKKKKQADQKEHMSHQYRLWQQQLTKSIESNMSRDEPYVLLHVANLVGLFTCIFIKASEKNNISNVAASTVKRGLGGLHGNKGALIVRFFLDDSSLCFINCHLAAGQSHTTSRNNDIAAILESASLPPEPRASARTDMFVGGGDGSMILDHEICILNGDLNYRIDNSREGTIQRVKNNDLGYLLERDQLLVERRKNPGFRLRVFSEGPITFAPTYKYDVGNDTYDSSEKKRSPAWCDRLLYRGLGKIKQTEYRRWEVKASDHRPVSGVFVIRIKTLNPDKRQIIWGRCKAGYEIVRARHVLDAKLDYLVHVCGYDADLARRTLEYKEEVIDAVRSLEEGR